MSAIRNITELQPAPLWRFFHEITQIPHGSGNITRIGDYLESFARERGLWVRRDACGNIYMRKSATPGYEDHPPVILQGHMDMVAVKDEGVDKDLANDPLDVETDGTDVWARGTSLGGDDGIAVAYCLALMDAGRNGVPEPPHPELEVLLTVDEEVGMEGARDADMDLLKGQRLINIDNEEEGVLLVSCAGGARFHASMPAPRSLPSDMQQGHDGERIYTLKIDGLQGGHSGEMIVTGRANACILMGRVLRRMAEELSESVALYSMEGGVADNAIAASCSAVLSLTEDAVTPAMELVRALEDEIAAEYAAQDPELGITLEESGSIDRDERPVIHSALVRLSEYLTLTPYGVQAMSGRMKGLVETSLNLGILSLRGSSETMEVDHSVRSSVDSAKDELLTKLRLLTVAYGGSFSISGEYPGWAYREDSPLRDTMKRVYEERYGKEPGIVSIHAGVECGLLSAKRPGLDCVSIGPDMRDIHTTGEHLSVASSVRTWEYLLAVLEAL